MAEPASDAKPAPNPARRRLLSLLAAVVVVGLLLYGIYWALVASHRVSTDNAYVGADTALVTPLINGPVAQVLVAETQAVKAGQPLVVLDDSDAKVGAAQAQAELAEAERKVRGYFANDTALAGLLDAREADVQHARAAQASAEGDLSRAQIDLSRREALKASGAVSGDEITTAQNRLTTAQAGLAEAKAALSQAIASRGAATGSRAVNAAMITGAGIDDNPETTAARAKLAAAQLTLSRTVLRAPIDGVISKKAVQVGQQVQIGAPLMSVVPVTQVYVDANYKEVQLKKVAIGQPVTLTSDLYGGGVKFHGRVVGLSGGTGAAFSLIPPQNASGNWIKVVQRLPVRIRLDPDELTRHPLRIGLSMKTIIDTSKAGD